MQKLRSQSAMEYLMTYGWAILIIAVVLGAIYSLGLFSGTSLAPRASPGSCQIYRPNGPLTTTYMTLAGSCASELPQYVAQISGTGSYVNFGNAPAMQISGNIAVSIWVKSTYSLSGSACSGGAALLLGDWTLGGQNNNALFWSDTCTSFAPEFFGGGSSAAGVALTTPNRYSDGRWHMLTGVKQGATIYFYVDGVQAATATPGAVSNLGDPWCISACLNNWPFSGYVADVQIYNSSLDANSVMALYQEGIGGVPVNLQNLVAWYPLNGNANDYSGDVNNGVPTNVVYTNQWLNGYTIP